MPTFPATLVQANAIKAIMQTAQINAQPAYANIIIGGLKDYTDAMPVGVVFAERGSSKRYTLGRSAKIHDETQFAIASAVNYDNAAAAEILIYSIRDEVTFLFEQSATLNTPGVIISEIMPDSEHYSFAQINGARCRFHEFLLRVVYEYTLPLGPQP